MAAMQLVEPSVVSAPGGQVDALIGACSAETIRSFVRGLREVLRRRPREELSIECLLHQATILSFMEQWAHRPRVVSEKLAALTAGAGGPELRASALEVVRAWRLWRPVG